MKIQVGRQELIRQVETRRQSLLAGKSSPARNEAANQLDYDLQVLQSARGQTVEAMAGLAERSRHLVRNARLGGVAAGLGLGLTAGCLNSGGLAGVGLGLMCGLIPGLVLGRFAQDAAASYAARHIQPVEVGEVLSRWADQRPTPDPLDRVNGAINKVFGGGSWFDQQPPSRSNPNPGQLAQEYFSALDLAARVLQAQPEGPARQDALQAIERDRISLSHLPGQDLSELEGFEETAARRFDLGRKVGLGLGVAFGLTAGAVGYSSGLSWLASGGLAASGGFISGVVLAGVGADLGQSLAPARPDSLEAAHRWKPLVAERRALEAKLAGAADEVNALARGNSAQVEVSLDEDSLQIGSVSIPLQSG
ncbi:MAG: hypothetical protein KC910_15575 [Candidatus Eremiobacteraeota bacterium]|nr:hypothetical protein [Candidatus Eremiobacteraeota bacterium]